MTRRRAPLYVSPSQLQSFAACERRWYYESVAGVARPDDAGGQYLALGTLVDYLAEAYSGEGRTSWSGAAEVVAIVRANPRNANVGQALDDAKWLELADRALRMFRALVGFLPAAGPGVTTQHRYRVPLAPGLFLTGRADVRAAAGGVVCDVKTTVDRGPGRGRDAKTPAYAKTHETLAEDWQARCYAWAEFQADPHRLSVETRWLYASKTTVGAAWAATRVFQRAETLAWFAEHVRPAIERMLELSATEGLAPEEAEANHDSCSRCFMRHACNPYIGRQKHDYQTADRTDGRRHLPIMASLAELRARQAGGAPPAVNRPAPAAPPAQAVLRPTPNANLMAQLVDALPPDPPTAPDRLDALAASQGVVVTESREDVYAALVAEAAEAANGTQDDRRADVAPRGPTMVNDVGEDVATVLGEPHSSKPKFQRVVAPREPAPGDHVDDAKAYVLGPNGPEARPVSEVRAAVEAGAELVVVAEPDPSVRRGRGRPRKPRSAAAEPAPAASADAQRTEALATAVQQFADAAATLVSRLNDELRRLGAL